MEVQAREKYQEVVYSLDEKTRDDDEEVPRSRSCKHERRNEAEN